MATTTTSTTTVRLSPVKSRRHGAPFVNFFSQLSRAHPDPTPPRTWQDSGRGGGWGTKHVLDDAPFDFWVEDEHQFRLWSPQEYDWIRAKYGAIAIAHCGNFLVIETDSPPNPVPLTVGGFPTMFVPRRLPGEPLYDPCLLRHNTDYASPQISDPITSFRILHWLDPTKDQMETIA
ncbi:hypothetical protein MMC29_005383 [Sticta canariensis]|nr:hypothetical protein [Sticta canariensis]